MLGGKDLKDVSLLRSERLGWAGFYKHLAPNGAFTRILQSVTEVIEHPARRM